MSAVRLVTLAPGHFHAALIQKEMQSGIDPTVHVYSELDSDLAAHVGRIAAFNARPLDPTSWKMEVHASDDWHGRFLRERPGNVAVLSGRNRAKIDLMRLAVEAGMHVLADKPWVIEPEDMPKLEALVEKAQRGGLLLHDVMTERHEITSLLQREVVDDPDLFGVIEAGDPAQPGVWMESIHYLKKQVAGVPLRRPGWFFDIAQQGEALADVGTHLVDLVLWTLFQDEPIDFARDARILRAQRWPTILHREHFEAITGLAEFPPDVEPWLEDENLNYYCNNSVVYTVRGVHVRLDVLWDYEAATGGGDTHNAGYRGSRCHAIVRQKGGQLPQLYVAPVPHHKQTVRDALARRVDKWQRTYPGVQLLNAGDEFHISIPDTYRTGHEAHFGEVTAEFLRLMQNPASRPAWETPNLLAKYRITTEGVALARRENA